MLFSAELAVIRPWADSFLLSRDSCWHFPPLAFLLDLVLSPLLLWQHTLAFPLIDILAKRFSSFNDPALDFLLRAVSFVLLKFVLLGKFDRPSTSFMGSMTLTRTRSCSLMAATRKSLSFLAPIAKLTFTILLVILLDTPWTAVGIWKSCL